MRVEQEQIKRVVAGLGREVRDDQVARSARHVPRPVAELDRGIREAVRQGVLLRRFHSADVCIYEHDFSIRPARGQRQTDSAVAATEIEHSPAWRDRCELVQKQGSAFINRFRREQSVSRGQAERPCTGL